jgi:hypothetical protein
MPLQATSGAASYDAFGGGVAAVPNYIEDVFSTWLYTGNGGTQTITNGIDLAGEGGLTWIKSRSATTNNTLFDTSRGVLNGIFTNLNVQQFSLANTVTSFNSNGFTLGNDNSGPAVNASGDTYASWTFRKAPKFFDVVTYTGNGGTQDIAHSLTSPPGCIIIKATSTTSDWVVYARFDEIDPTTPVYKDLRLNTTAASTQNVAIAGATTFTVGGLGDPVNTNGVTYVAYLFAHNAGGFGLTGTDNVISCGSYTGTGAAGNFVTLGFEPQWVMIKRTDASANWRLFDSMRGMPVIYANGAASLFPDLADAEASGSGFFPTATGFSPADTTSGYNASGGSYIYIAIRRGPMKVPTDGTSVYTAMQNDGVEPGYSTSFTVDSAIQFLRQSGFGVSWQKYWGSRLTGTGEILTSSTAAEQSNSEFEWDYQNGFSSNTGTNYFAWLFRRAPGFFDVVCYTGDDVSGRTVPHNLGVAPEMMIVKSRGDAESWCVYSAGIANPEENYLYLNESSSLNPNANTIKYWNHTLPTDSVFTLGDEARVNQLSDTYIAYLFATCPGVSKVGGYTGTAAAQTINCGFAGGARFVLIKRTDSTGDWYVWDSARGIVAGNDPYLLLNSTAAEVTNTDYVDTAATGFEISSTAPAAINASGGNFIFLAIA